MGARPSSLAEQVARAQATVATWSPEKLASMQLQGTDPFHERRLREKAAEGRPDAAVQPRHALAPIRASTGRQGELACFGRLAFERMQEVSPPFGKPLTWNDISDRTREVWADVAGTIAAAAVAANKTKREDRECRAN